MVTIKSAIFLPSFLFLLALPLFGERKTGLAAGSLATGVLAMVAAFFALFTLHDLSLVAATPNAASHFVVSSFDKTVRGAEFFPGLSYFLRTLQVDFCIWILLVVGIVLTLVKILHSQGEERQKGMALIALAAPLGSLLVYRNTFPYFYVFLMAPPAVLIAVSWQALGSHHLVARTGLAVPTIKLFTTLYLLLNLIIERIFLPHVIPLSHQAKYSRRFTGCSKSPFPISAAPVSSLPSRKRDFS